LKLLDSVDAGTNPPEVINVVVEIPKGSSIKYEFDSVTGLLFVDRKLYTAMFYPFNYGFIPMTLEMDGDPVDVLILGEDPVVPLSIVRSRPVGVLLTFSKVNDAKDIPEHIQNQIKHFFEHYKELEQGKFVKVKGWERKEIAMNKIVQSIQRYKEKAKQ
jgi:inorganic pyrophosphatase